MEKDPYLLVDRHTFQCLVIHILNREESTKHTSNHIIFHASKRYTESNCFIRRTEELKTARD